MFSIFSYFSFKIVYFTNCNEFIFFYKVMSQISNMISENNGHMFFIMNEKVHILHFPSLLDMLWKVCINISNNNNERTWMWKTSHLIFPAIVINNTDLKKNIHERVKIGYVDIKENWLIDWLTLWMNWRTDGSKHYINIPYCMEYNLRSNSFVNEAW